MPKEGEVTEGNLGFPLFVYRLLPEGEKPRFVSVRNSANREAETLGFPLFVT